MQLNNLQRVHKNKRQPPVGRGGKRGKTSGRGTKGQKARAGRKIRPEMRDVIKRLPKLRGRGSNFLKSRQVGYQPINLGALEKGFAAGEVVSRETLFEKGLIRDQKTALVKVLADGELTKSLVFKGCKVSAPAKVKIEKAGGKIEA
jgi:large subunit ribosomal protein L15